MGIFVKDAEARALREEVRQLKEAISALQLQVACHSCHHYNYQPVPYTPVQPYVIWSASGTQLSASGVNSGWVSSG